MLSVSFRAASALRRENKQRACPFSSSCIKYFWSEYEFPKLFLCKIYSGQAGRAGKLLFPGSPPGNWPAELMRYALPASGRNTRPRKMLRDNVCIIKKTGVLHNAENIATRATRAHVAPIHRKVCPRTARRPSSVKITARNRCRGDVKNDGIIYTRALSFDGYICKFQG